jgi:CheY-like chemotaxis protein
LIADDEPFNIMALEGLLESEGIVSDSVYDGQSLIEKIIENKNKDC